MKSIISILFCGFILSSCQEEIPCKSFMVGEPFTIPIKKTITHCTEPISITFLQLVSDSRCPIGATCIWEGMVEVQISVNQNGQEEVFNLSSSPNFGNKVPNNHIIDGYLVKLEDVKPFPNLSKNIDEKEREVILMIQKSESPE